MAAWHAAPRGPNYSVTAGEHGEPADGEPHIYMYGPKGVERAYALHSQPRQQAGGELPPEGCRRRIPTHDERSTPLGPMVMGATFRGFATLTRGYRVVRPLRGRQLRGMCCTDIGTRTAVPPRHVAGMATGPTASRDALHRHRHEDSGTTTACCGDGVAPAILQRNGDGDGGPKGAELLCNRG